ncbi:MotA/TolQ/ExbB proton channel family protein [Tunicatimonas pelagia]|uniref:MotA/TolQ/ExbB proton channel family protein n=1 Tax=Tunicatimonas pelagia TaxID=931531 RepID=UPI00266556CF|nr:MotA/TolQ/ExbB proton channel family protein [Tunicatimonas pelagia]WKN43466.1 MotA/TolQ/ExbB proton channel family protein [Tunicatimonas pelagia]
MHLSTKKLHLFGLIFLFFIGTVQIIFAQNDSSQREVSRIQDTLNSETVTPKDGNETKETSSEGEAVPNLHQVIREQFINGDWRFMTPVLLCLILGLLIAIERIVHLNLATSNVEQTLTNLRGDLQSGGVNQALHRLQQQRSSVAMIFRQSLEKWEDGIEVVEKAIVSYGSVEMGKLEKGLVWISLFISIAPMLGFMGTVIGMINAFDAIEAAGDISPTLVASGIKTALLTTVAGLIVAIILQLFYNYCVAKIDSLVNDMERASIAFVDILVDLKNEGTEAP